MALPVVPSEQRSKVLSEALKLVARDGLGLPPELMSDQTIEYLSDSFESTPQQTLLSRSLVETLFNEQAFEQADRIQKLYSAWQADDRTASVSGSPDVFLPRVLAFVPLADVNNRANDAAAAAAIERFQRSNVLARLVLASQSLGDAKLRFERDGDESLQVLSEALADAFKASAIIADGGLVQKGGVAYASVLHNYIDAMERSITSLEAIAFVPNAVPLSAPTAPIDAAADSTSTTERSQCHFSQLFGIVHSASGKGDVPVADASRGRSPARDAGGRSPARKAKRREPATDAVVPNSIVAPTTLVVRELSAALAPERSADAVSRTWGIDTQGLTAADVGKEAYNFVVRTLLGNAIAVLRISLRVTQIALGLIYAVANVYQTTPANLMEIPKRAWNEAWGVAPYKDGRDASFLESFLFGTVISFPDLADNANQATRYVLDLLKGDDSGPFARQSTGDIYISGSIFRIEQSIRARVLKMVIGILRLQGGAAFSGNFWDDFLSVLILIAGFYMIAASIKNTAALFTDGVEGAVQYTVNKTAQVAVAATYKTKDGFNALLARVVVLASAPARVVGRAINAVNRNLAPQKQLLLTPKEMFLLKDNGMIDESAAAVRRNDLTEAQLKFLYDALNQNRPASAARSQD
jgi:hypothetical protein